MKKHLIYLVLFLTMFPTISASFEYYRDPLENILDELSMCESSNNEKAWNKADPITPSIGLHQYKIETWNWATKLYGYEGLDIMNGEDQKKVTRSLLNDGRWGHWYSCLHKIYE